MAWQKIPTLEEIYNEFHKQYWYVTKGFYPRTIKNYDKILNDKVSSEYLLRFQNLLKRNANMIDWKLYIKANAEILKGRFNLKVLGTLGATKIYKNYLIYLNKFEDSEETIKSNIISSLKFLNLFLSENNLTFETYLLTNAETTPLSLQHLYSGTISLYFYACFPGQLLNSFFSMYQDDIFFELFEMNKYDFINNVLMNKRLDILKYKSIIAIATKLEEKFLKNNK